MSLFQSQGTSHFFQLHKKSPYCCLSCLVSDLADHRHFTSIMQSPGTVQSGVSPAGRWQSGKRLLLYCCQDQTKPVACCDLCLAMCQSVINKPKVRQRVHLDTLFSTAGIRVTWQDPLQPAVATTSLSFKFKYIKFQKRLSSFNN